MEWVTKLLNSSGNIGLSPSIHSIDQIKVVDRFRGELLAPPHSIPSTYHFTFQKSHMKVPWPTLYGQTPMLKRRTLLFPLGMDRRLCFSTS